jgi:pilus assembly protein CpaF
MITMVLTEKGGQPESKKFQTDEITIGRLAGNDIVLAKNNISKKHIKIVNQDGKMVVIDLKSTNGTYVNGKRIDGPYELKEGDKVYIGNYVIDIEQPGAESEDMPPPPPAEEAAPAKKGEPGVESAQWDVEDVAVGEGDDEWDDDWDAAHGKESKGDDFDLDGLLNTVGEPAAAAPKGKGGKPKVDAADLQKIIDDAEKPVAPRSAAAQAAPQPISEDEATPPPSGRKEAPAKAAGKARPAPKAKPKAPPAHGGSESEDAYSAALAEVHRRLVASLDLRRLDVESMADEELRERTNGAISEIVDSMEAAGELPAGLDMDRLVNDVLNEALGLGPLTALLEDESVTEIMVNSHHQIYIERKGRLELSDTSFSSDQAVLGVIERIVAPLGRRIDESSPMVDARLKDGSRVNAVIPPVALRGPTITIRKFTREPLAVDDLVGFGTLNAAMAQFLEIAVVSRKNIVISGGTGSGKTTTLNVLSSFIPETERIVTIEDAAELKLGQDHIVALESRPPNIEGKGAIAIRDLVRNALRMRPDRIVVGECRGGEALDMLQAMNTGHDGSLTTLHANAPRDCLSRLETMVLMSGMELPMRAIRDQISSAIDIVVQQSRFPDGSRRITHISEITGMEVDVITMQDIFVFEQSGYDEHGKVVGIHKPTGFVPKFYEELKHRGIKADFSIFQVAE